MADTRNKVTDEDVIKYFYTSYDRIYGKRFISFEKTHKPDDIYDYVVNRFNDSESLRESIIRIRCNIKEHPKCPICGKPVLFMGKRKRMFLNTCSLECGFKLRQQHNEQLWLERENVTNAFAAKDSKIKIKQTKKERYNDENYNNNQKTVITCLLKYNTTNGGGTPQAVQKIKKTQFANHNGKWAVQDEAVKQKMRDTCTEKFGYDNYMKSPAGKERYRDLCFIRYGVDWTGSLLKGRKRSDDVIQHLKEISWFIQEKRRETMKRNGSYKETKPEKDVFNELLLYFDESDIDKQHHDDVYPYNCDFYVHSINTYIEVQGSQFHNFRPYDPSNENDQKEFDELMKKINEGKTQPISIIKTWTKSDVEKRNCAKENNLNFIEIWPSDNISDVIRKLAKEHSII